MAPNYSRYHLEFPPPSPNLRAETSHLGKNRGQCIHARSMVSDSATLGYIRDTQSCRYFLAACSAVNTWEHAFFSPTGFLAACAAVNIYFHVIPLKRAFLAACAAVNIWDFQFLEL